MILASLLTASMFTHPSLVAYPIVSKLGFQNQAIAVTVGGTILTDAVLIILAVVMGKAQGL